MKKTFKILYMCSDSNYNNGLQLIKHFNNCLKFLFLNSFILIIPIQLVIDDTKIKQQTQLKVFVKLKYIDIFK